MDNESLALLGLIGMGIGLLALTAVGVLYWHFKRKFAKKARNLDSWVS